MAPERTELHCVHISPIETCARQAVRARRQQSRRVAGRSARGAGGGRRQRRRSGPQLKLSPGPNRRPPHSTRGRQRTSARRGGATSTGRRVRRAPRHDLQSTRRAQTDTRRTGTLAHGHGRAPRATHVGGPRGSNAPTAWRQPSTAATADAPPNIHRTAPSAAVRRRTPERTARRNSRARPPPPRRPATHADGWTRTGPHRGRTAR